MLAHLSRRLAQFWRPNARPSSALPTFFPRTLFRMTYSPAAALLILALRGGVSFAETLPPPTAAEAQPPVLKRTEPHAPRTSGFTASLFVGFNKLLGDVGEGANAGPRLGGSLGVHLNRNVSLNGELAMDVFSPDSISDFSRRRFYLSVVPTLHVPISKGQLLIAPKFGRMRASRSVTSDGKLFHQSMSGYVVGVKAALGFNVGSMLIGPLVMMETTTITKSCTDGEFGGCITGADIRSASVSILSLALGVWF
jgi:hypothetical protein